MPGGDYRFRRIACAVCQPSMPSTAVPRGMTRSPCCWQTHGKSGTPACWQPVCWRNRLRRVSRAAGDARAETLYALAAFTQPDTLPWYLDRLQQWLSIQETALATPPDPLPLLCFVKGLLENGISDDLFAACVLRAGVLHPAVSSHRPWRRLHRLLDYLGLSDNPQVQRAYRQLVAGSGRPRPYETGGIGVG